MPLRIGTQAVTYTINTPSDGLLLCASVLGSNRSPIHCRWSFCRLRRRTMRATSQWRHARRDRRRDLRRAQVPGWSRCWISSGSGCPLPDLAHGGSDVCGARVLL